MVILLYVFELYVNIAAWTELILAVEVVVEFDWNFAVVWSLISKTLNKRSDPKSRKNTAIAAVIAATELKIDRVFEWALFLEFVDFLTEKTSLVAAVAECGRDVAANNKEMIMECPTETSKTQQEVRNENNEGWSISSSTFTYDIRSQQHFSDNFKQFRM